MTDDTLDGASVPATPLKLLIQYLKDLSFENPGAPHVHIHRGDLPRAELRRP